MIPDFTSFPYHSLAFQMDKKPSERLVLQICARLLSPK